MKFQGPLADAVIEDSDEANVRVLERKDIGKGRFWFRLAPDVKGDFGISIIGGIDHGFAPYISKTDQNGLRSGDTIVAINNVPGRAHFRVFNNVGTTYQELSALNKPGTLNMDQL